MSPPGEPSQRKRPAPLNLSSTKPVPGTLRTPHDLAQDIAVQCLSPTLPRGLSVEMLKKSRDIEAQQRQIIANLDPSGGKNRRASSASSLDDRQDRSDRSEKSERGEKSERDDNSDHSDGSMTPSSAPVSPVDTHDDDKRNSEDAQTADSSLRSSENEQSSMKHPIDTAAGPTSAGSDVSGSMANVSRTSITALTSPTDLHAQQYRSVSGPLPPLPQVPIAQLGSSSAPPSATFPPMHDGSSLQVRRGARPVLLDIEALKRDKQVAPPITPLSATLNVPRKRNRDDEEDYSEQRALDDEDEERPPQQPPRILHGTGPWTAYPQQRPMPFFDAGIAQGLNTEKKAKFMKLCSEMWDLFNS